MEALKLLLQILLNSKIQFIIRSGDIPEGIRAGLILSAAGRIGTCGTFCFSSAGTFLLADK